MAANPWTIAVTFDTTEVTASPAIAADTLSRVCIGNSVSTTMTCYFDDLVLSNTIGDYPIGAGGTERLAPSSDGTHNAGTNIMEDQAGTDIGATTAYDKINSDPPDSTTYIRQAGTGTGNYAEVLFGDIQASHSAIIGVMARLAFTSATTTSNRGAAIVSVDNFTNLTTLWGNPTTTADYSDGSTTNLFYKSAIVSDAVSDSTVCI